MKKKIINIKKTIILVGLVLMINISFAGGDKISPIMNDLVLMEINLNLQPLTPIEATFDDEVIDIDINKLKPITPKEAIFEEDTIK